MAAPADDTFDPAYRPRRSGNGRFAPGSSGNPGGKLHPPHTPDVSVRLLRDASPELVIKAIAMAMAGDGQVMRALLDRVVPPPRGRPITLPQPMPSTPLEAIDVVIAATAAGTLTPDEAGHLVDLFNIRAQVAELPALQERIARLEALLAGQPKAVIDALELDP
jgi:hypothetical protein